MNLARVSGLFYVLTIAAGSWAAFGTGSWRGEANVVAAASYVVVTILFYRLFAPVQARLSLVAATVSLAGCAASAAAFAGVLPRAFNPLPIFGVYCLLLGWLTTQSTMPRALGVLLMMGGVGWLTFLPPSLARALAPYNFVPGIIAESALTLWLLVFAPRVTRRVGHARVRNQP